MAISFRTPLSVTAASSAGFSMPTPVGTTDGDLLVAVVSNAGTTGPAAPTGWTSIYAASAGTGQCCSIFTAPYSGGLTLSFTNAASACSAVCGAYYEASKNISLDVAAVAATNTTSNTTLPTGAPTTGSATGDFEVLAYTWTSAATISAVAAGSTIDKTQANSTTISAALGHNNTTSLGATTATTAFSQTLSAANTRKTGVGVLLKATAPATRQVGGADLNVDITDAHTTVRVGVAMTQVDLMPPLLRLPQPASLGINVDVVVPLGVQYGGMSLVLDATSNPARALGAIGIMVDYVAGLITAGIGWSGTQFVASGATPVLWGTAAFQTTGGYPAVQWEDGAFAT